MPSIPNITQTVYYTGSSASYDNWANTGLTFSPGMSYQVSADKAALLLDSGQFSSSSFAQVDSRTNTLAILGDSFDVRSSAISLGADYQYQQLGIWLWTNALLNQSFNINNVDAISGTGAIQNAGVAGQTYAERIQRGVYDLKPRYASIRVSVNDLSSATSWVRIRNAYEELFAGCNERGITVITNTMGPLTTAAGNLDTTARREIWAKLNEWLLYTAPTKYDLITLQQHYQYLDPDALTGQVVGNADVHPPLRYVYQIAKKSAAQLADITRTMTTPASALCIVGDGASALDPNPMNIGTGGAPGTNGVGSVADSYSFVTTGSLGTMTHSKVARTDAPGYWQQTVWTPSAANQLIRMFVLNRALNYDMAIGDVIQPYMEFAVDSATAAADAVCPRLNVLFNGPGTGITGFAVGADNSPNESGWSGVFIGPKMAIPAGTTSISLYWGAFNQTTGACTMRIGRHGIINLTTLARNV